MLTKNIRFKNFLFKTKNTTIKKLFQKLLNNKPKLLETLRPEYEYNYSKKLILKHKKINNIRIIGMGGSILGSQAIYDFLKKKLKKNLLL